MTAAPVRSGRARRRVLGKGKGMSQPPKQIADATSQIINAWNTLAPGATFAGMTLAQFKAKVQPTFDTRTLIDGLNAQLTAAMDNRDNADGVTSATNQLIVNAVKGDPNFGDDSDLYDAMGYVRRSARASGLSRGGKTPAPAAPQK
jgi:hypothetical protein